MNDIIGANPSNITKDDILQLAKNPPAILLECFEKCQEVCDSAIPLNISDTCYINCSYTNCIQELLADPSTHLKTLESVKPPIANSGNIEDLENHTKMNSKLDDVEKLEKYITMLDPKVIFGKENCFCCRPENLDEECCWACLQKP